MKLQDLLYWALVHGDSILFWVLTALGGMTARLVLAHVKNATVNGVVGRALSEIGDAVLLVGHTYVDDLKAASADGSLTPEEAARAKSDAIDVAKKNIGAAGLAKLAKVLGVDDLDHWLETKVESAVATVNKTGISTSPGVKPAAAPDPR